MNIDSFFDLFNPETLIRIGGVEIVLLIVFIETGLFFGFFLPGDSLLFIVGMLCSSKVLAINIFVLWLLLLIAAVAGSALGYVFGTKAVKFFNTKRENFFYRKRYLDETQLFFNKYDMWVFVLGRFLPGIRTFVPIFAGMVNINFKEFMLFNVVGVTVWISLLLFAGYVLSHVFPILIDRLELIVGGIVTITIIPVVYTWVKSRRKMHR